MKKVQYNNLYNHRFMKNAPCNLLIKGYIHVLEKERNKKLSIFLIYKKEQILLQSCLLPLITFTSAPSENKDSVCVEYNININYTLNVTKNSNFDLKAKIGNKVKDIRNFEITYYYIENFPNEKM